VAAVTLTAHDGRILYQNANYVFREQYQSSTTCHVHPGRPGCDSAAVQPVLRAQLVADVLEGF